MNKLERDGGSYRDDFGYVYSLNNRIYRVLSDKGERHFQKLHKSAILEELYEKKYIVKTDIVMDDEIIKFFPAPSMVLEHAKIDNLTYPYEWGFEQLKTAALFHLDFQLYLLQREFVLRDASAYNVQFLGPTPVFIDVLSIAPYEKGEIWFGYKQFCENFLFPLLLTAKLGISHRQLYRSNLEGISREEITALLPIRSLVSIDAISHIVIPNFISKRANSQFSAVNKRTVDEERLSISKYRAILQNLRNWIGSLEAKVGKSVWSEYADNTSYTETEENLKLKTITSFVRKHKIRNFLDLGCNTGLYSRAALNGGAKSGVSIDFDQRSVDALFLQAKSEKLNLLPVCVDLTNPSPGQGWLQSERKGFDERFRTEATFSLALMHHLIIAKNIPLQQAVEFLVQFSPKGLIEYVPQNDEMAQVLLRQRRNNAISYTREDFEQVLSRIKNICAVTEVKSTGRIMYEYG